MVTTRKGGIMLNCENCPYDDPQERYNRYARLNPDWQPEYLWCDKVGGEHWQCGYCCDCVEDNEEHANIKKRTRTNHHDNLVKHKKNAIRCAVESQHGGYYSADGNCFNVIRENKPGKLYSHKIYASGIRKYCRKQTNRKTRHTNVGNYGAYRRLFDYWGTMYW